MKFLVGPRDGMDPVIPEIIEEISRPDSDDNFDFRHLTEEDSQALARLEKLSEVGLVGMVAAHRAYDPSQSGDGIGTNLYLPVGSRRAITSFRRQFMGKVEGFRANTIPPTQEHRDVLATDEQKVLRGTLEDLSSHNLRLLGAFMMFTENSEPPLTASTLVVSKALQERWDFLLRDKALAIKARGADNVLEEAEINDRAVLNPDAQSFAAITLSRLMTNKTVDIPRHLFRLTLPRKN